MNKLTNVEEAAAFAHQKLKSAKKAQVKGHACKGKTDLNSHIYVVRDGQPEVLLICDDDSIKSTFRVGARMFAGDLVVLALDGTCMEGERRHLLALAADRMGNMGFVQQFYDATHDGLALDKPVTVGKPSFLRKKVQKDMRKMMREPILEIPEPLIGALKDFKENIDSSPEAVRAFLDITVAGGLRDLREYMGIRRVAMISEPDSPRGKALVRPGLPIFK